MTRLHCTSPCLPWLLLAMLLGPAAPSPAKPVDEDLPITFVLEHASARDVFEILATLRQLTLQLDPDVTGSITVDLQEVPLDVALDEICDQADCQWHIRQGDPGVLVVRSTKKTAERITLDMDDRPLRDVLVAIQSEGGITVKLAPSLDPELPVSVRVRDQPVSVVLDALSAQLGARWTLAGGVCAIYPDVWNRPGGSVDQQVPPPVLTGIRLESKGREVGAPRRIRLSWSRPVVTASLLEDGKTELVLSWLPLGPDGVRLLPFVVECGDSGARLVHRFDLIDPAERGVHRVDLGDTTLEIVPDAPRSWPVVQTPANAPVCGRTDAPLLDLELGVKGEQWVTKRQLVELPGRFWIAAAGLEGVTLAKDRSIGALVYLGRSSAADGLHELLVVSRQGAAGRVLVQPLTVAAAMSRTVALSPDGDDGPTYTITVRAPR